MKPSFTTRPRWMLVVVLFALANLAMPVNHAAADADPYLDQYQDYAGGNGSYWLFPGMLPDGGSSRLGQTFTAGRSGVLNHIQLFIGFSCWNETTWMLCGEEEIVRLPLVVQVYRVDTNGLPTGAALSRTSFVPDLPNDPGTGEWVDVNIPGVVVTAGSSYAITWWLDEYTGPTGDFSPDHNTYLFDIIDPWGWIGMEAPVAFYEGGTAVEVHPSSWQIAVDTGMSLDFPFRTYVHPFPTDAKEDPNGSAAATTGAQTFRAWRSGPLSLLSPYIDGRLNGIVPTCEAWWTCGYNAPVRVTFDLVEVSAPDFNPATGSPIASAISTVSADGNPEWATLTWQLPAGAGSFPYVTAGHSYALVVRESHLQSPPEGRPWSTAQGTISWSMAPRTYEAGNAWHPERDFLHNFVFRASIN